ncbi:MAG: S8 family serine peptidase [Bacteroidota bacterium]
MKRICTLILFAFGFLFASAQQVNENYSILFKSGVVQLQPNADDFTTNSDLNQFGDFNQRIYVLLQFNSIPTIEQRQSIEASGIHLLDYIPHFAFYASLPSDFDPTILRSLDVRSLSEIKANYKLSQALRNNSIPDYAIKQKGTVDLNVLYFNDVARETAINELISNGANVIKTSENLKTITIRINSNEIEKFSALPFVAYMETIAPDPTPDDTKGRSLHRSNVINSEQANGLHFDGSGIHVAIADDGSINHIDFKGRWTDHTDGSQGGTHGDMTSGICVGAGNLDPTITGMATGAHLHEFLVTGYPQIVDAIANYTNDSIVLVSTSYSQGCNEYTSDSQFGDELIYDNPQLEFIFSAGNNNGDDCGYGAGTQWANITGGYKSGKNVIACANVNADGIISSSSSRGPASDGRVKPDIAANGTNQMSTDENNTYQVGGGTSAAAPGVAGVSAQLCHAYRAMNSGQEINTALLKATLLNTASEIGNPGPDYIFGWGRVNAMRAYDLLAGNNFIFDSVSQGQQKIFNISIPPNTTLAKVMVYWHDYEGSPAASKALVNDLNISMTDVSSTNYLPLILDPTPDEITLNNFAVPGVDTLNNAEQIQIESPSAGNYTLTVDGFEVPQGVQKFYVVWDLIADGIKITYPNGAEGFVAGEQEVIRWDDASQSTQSYTAEYSTDYGSTWNTISANIPFASRQLTFSVPSVSTDMALIRIFRGSDSDVNDNTFSIFPEIQNFVVAFECPDSVGLQWAPVSGAVTYEVSMLGDMYMDSVATTSNSSVTIYGTVPNVDKWFSVRAVGANGGKGRRATAIFKPAGTINCPLAFDNEIMNLVSPVSGTYRDCPSNGSVDVTIQIRSLSINTVSNFPVSYRLNTGTVVTETYTGTLNTFDTVSFTFSVPVTLLPTGSYQLAVWVSLPGDMNSYNDSVFAQIDVIDGNIGLPPLTEDLETSFPPFGFLIANPDSDITWASRTVIGANSFSTTAAYLNNFSYNATGEEDYLETRVYDLTGMTNAYLTFDVAHAPYSATFVDGLRIDVSTNCGDNFIPTGYFKEGLTLGTLGSYNTTLRWEPTDGTEWRNDSVDLSAFAGQQVILRFASINGYGNSLYIDNINVANLPVGVKEYVYNTSVTIYPNPAKEMFNIYCQDVSNEEVTVNLFDAMGRSIKTMRNNFTQNNNFEMRLSGVAKGIYTIELNSSQMNSRAKVVVN